MCTESTIVIRAGEALAEEIGNRIIIKKGLKQFYGETMYSFDRLMRESREAKLKVQIFNDWITASEFYSDLTQKRVKKLCDFVAGFLEIDLPEIRFIDTFEGYEKASGMSTYIFDEKSRFRF